MSLGHSRNLPSSRKHGDFPKQQSLLGIFQSIFFVPVFSSNSFFPVHFKYISFFVVSENCLMINATRFITEK